MHSNEYKDQLDSFLQKLAQLKRDIAVYKKIQHLIERFKHLKICD